MEINIFVFIAIIVGCIAVAGIIAFLAGVSHRKKAAEATIGSAEQEAKRIVSDAIKTAEAKKRETILEGKDEIHRLRSESDNELRERRNEVQRQERRIQQKEETLDKKLENLERKEENLTTKNKQIDERLREAEEIKKREFEILEKISGFTIEQAKQFLLENLENELTHE